MTPPPIYISMGGMTPENQSQEQGDSPNRGGVIIAAAAVPTTTGDVTTIGGIDAGIDKTIDTIIDKAIDVAIDAGIDTIDADTTTTEDMTTTKSAIISGIISQWLRDKSPAPLATIPYSDDVEDVIYQLPNLNSFLRNELIVSWQSVKK